MPLLKSKEVTDKAVKQLYDFQTGKTKPLATGIDHLDYHLLGGLYPSNVLGIAGLSGHGKSYMLEQLLNNLRKNNDNVLFVECQWELEPFIILSRDISKKSAMSIRDVLNTNPDENTHLKQKFKEVADEHRQENILLQPEPVTVNTFYNDIVEVIENNLDKKIVVSIDNLENLLLETDQKRDLDRLIQSINILKKKHPYICFIVLNQLNRSIAERENPKYHAPTEGDLYGTAALTKLTDLLVVKHLPYKLGIEKYMVFSNKRYKYIDDEFIIRSDRTSTFDAVGVAFYHYIKSRAVEEEYDFPDLYCERLFYPPKEGFEKDLDEEESTEEKSLLP